MEAPLLDRHLLAPAVGAASRPRMRPLPRGALEGDTGAWGAPPLALAALEAESSATGLPGGGSLHAETRRAVARSWLENAGRMGR